VLVGRKHKLKDPIKKDMLDIVENHKEDLSITLFFFLLGNAFALMSEADT